MKTLKKYFGEWNMTWPRVILLAVLAAVYTAVVNLLPFLYDTSFQDIAVTLECWFLFAVFIIVNCKTWWEASLKCFVFFLISQPLIYLIEVPFTVTGWGLFGYYGYWFKITLLTLPGAAIAFFVKKKNWLSVLILSVATGYLAIQSVYYFGSAAAHFPRHLLSALFCLALAVFFIFVLLDEKKLRAAALGIFAAVFLVCGGVTLARNTGGVMQEIDLGDGPWVCISPDDDIVDVAFSDDSHALVTSQHSGWTTVDFQNDDGTVVSYNIVVDGRNLMISPID